VNPGNTARSATSLPIPTIRPPSVMWRAAAREATNGPRSLTANAREIGAVWRSRAGAIYRLRWKVPPLRVTAVSRTAETVSSYPPLNVCVRMPGLSLLGATDELLEHLVPTVRKGVVAQAPWPFDDPMSLYKDGPEREWSWLRAVWAGRGKVNDGFWRLYFVVVVDDEPVGMQDLIGIDFSVHGTVTTFSWLSPEMRGRGLGKLMRQAVLHLAF
jgi:hypothetical protein